jgi:hypothetical protein
VIGSSSSQGITPIAAITLRQTILVLPDLQSVGLLLAQAMLWQMLQVEYFNFNFLNANGNT